MCHADPLSSIIFSEKQCKSIYEGRLLALLVVLLGLRLKFQQQSIPTWGLLLDLPTVPITDTVRPAKSHAIRV